MLKLPILRGKENISRIWGFNVSPTTLGIACSLIIFCNISKFYILLGVVLIRNEGFS